MAGPTPGSIPAIDQTAEPAIQVIAMNKWYGQFHVLRDINLTVARGERIVICGPSGSGKSTLIRCINRLEEHQKGQIIVDGVELTDDLKNIEQVRREVGMVFQHFNLFPHLTVLQNLHARADLGAQDAEGPGRSRGDDVSGARAHPGAGGQVPGPALRAASSSASRSPARSA